MLRVEARVDEVRDDLLVHWKAEGKRKQQLSLTLRHGLGFSTWRALKTENPSDTQIAELIVPWQDK